MSLHQLRDGRWIVIRYDRQTRKQVRKYFGRGSDAEAQARTYNDSLPTRHYSPAPAPGSILFAALAQLYAQSRAGIVQAVSLKNWYYKMESVILPAIGMHPAIDLTPDRLDSYVSTRLQSVKRTTVHRELSDIRAVLSWAARRRYIPFHPCLQYDMPRRDDTIITPPTAAELAAIMAHACPRLKRAIALAYYTGSRPGSSELLSIRWDDVDLAAGTIVVRSARKGGLKSRTVPAHTALLPLLVEWYEADKGTSGRATGYLIHDTGKRIGSLKTAWKAAKRRAKITRRLPLYALRHAFATETLRAGSDLKSVSAILGHTRTDTTTRIYQHVGDAMARDAVGRLPELCLQNGERVDNDQSVCAAGKCNGK